MSSQVTDADAQPSSAAAGPSASGTPAPMTAAKPPVGMGSVPVVGVVLSLVLVALGVVGIHDALVAAGWVDGDPWIDTVVEQLDGWRAELWLVPVGIALALLGLWLLLLALRPRPRTGIAVTAKTGVYLRTGDVERLVERAASEVDGVLSASAEASRRKVEVRATVTGGSSTEELVRVAVEDALDALESQPKIQIKLTRTGAGA